MAKMHDEVKKSRLNPATTQPTCNGIWVFNVGGKNKRSVLVRVTTKNGEFYSGETPCRTMVGKFTLFKAE